MNQVYLAELDKTIQIALDSRNYHKAAELAAGMVAIAELDEDMRNCFLGKYLLGVAYYHLHDYTHSMEKYLDLNNLILALETDVAALELPRGLMDRVRYGMAANMYYLGDLDGAAIVLQHVLESGTASQVVLHSAILLGVVYLMMYDLNQDARLLAITMEMYLTLLEEVNLSRSQQTMIYNNLAILFTYQKEYTKAQEMLNNAFQGVATPSEMISIFNEMSRIHLQQKNLDKVRKNLERAKEYLQEGTDPAEEAQYYTLAGMLQREEENYAGALRLLSKGFHVARLCHHHIEQTRACRELTVLSERMGTEFAGEYASEYQDLMEGINPIKEVITWQPIWSSIVKAHASLTRKSKNVKKE